MFVIDIRNHYLFQYQKISFDILDLVKEVVVFIKVVKF